MGPRQSFGREQERKTCANSILNSAARPFLSSQTRWSRRILSFAQHSCRPRRFANCSISELFLWRRIGQEQIDGNRNSHEARSDQEYVTQGGQQTCSSACHQIRQQNPSVRYL